MGLTSHTRRSRIFSLAIAVSLASGSIVCGDSFTWTGGGDNANWDNLLLNPPRYANWGDVNVLPGTNDAVTFGSGFSSGNPNLNGSRSVFQLNVDTTVPFTIAGNPGDVLTLGAGGLTRTSASSGTQTIAVPIQISADQSWTLNGSGAIALNGGLSSGGAGYGLTKAGTADLLFTGGSSTIGGALNVTGGNLILDSTSFTTIAQGTGTVQVLNPRSQLVVRNGATLNNAGSAIIDLGGAAVVTGAGSAWTNTPDASNVSGFTIGGSGVGLMTVSDGATVSSSIFFLGDVAGGNGTLNIQSGGNVNLSVSAFLGNNGGSAGTINLTGSGSSLTAGSGIQMGGSAPGAGKSAGTLNISNGATVNLSGLGLSFNSPNTTVNINGGTLTTNRLNSQSNFGTINLQSDPAGGHALVVAANSLLQLFTGNITGLGSVLVDGAHGPEFDGINTYTGATIIQSGELVLSGPLNSSSLYDIKNGSTLQLDGSTTLNLGSGQILNEAGGFVLYNALTINGVSFAAPATAPYEQWSSMERRSAAMPRCLKSLPT